MTSSANAAECERAAVRAYLLGADDECARHWEAAYRAALAAGESLRIAPDTEIVLDAPRRLYLQHGTAYLDSGTRPARAGKR